MKRHFKNIDLGRKPSRRTANLARSMRMTLTRLSLVFYLQVQNARPARVGERKVRLCMYNDRLFFIYLYQGPVELMTNAMESLGTTDAEPEEENEELTGLVVLQLKKKDQVCQRHIQQLFIRGEQVALVSVLPV